MRFMLKSISISLILFACVFCTQTNNDEVKPMINKSEYGKMPDGKVIYAFDAVNANGAKMQVISYGAIVTKLIMPDKEGKFADVVLGYDNLEGYVRMSPYFGAIVGRYGNRIGKGKFTLDGTDYQLDINDGENHLHGGSKGFDKVVWTGEIVERKEGPAVKMTYVSPDGEMGYPGDVTLSVVIILSNNNELIFEYSGTTDKPTILNPTHHGYFNLTGNPENTILDHYLMINAHKFTPVDAGLITTGELEDVEGTPFDFTTATKIGERINEDNQQLKYGKGYDHNWVIDDYNDSVKTAATLYDETSGRFMEVLTDEPGIQFYSGNFLDGTITGKNGIVYKRRTGLCLEAQHYPDSPNKENFPSVTLRPGETYSQKTIYRFSTK
jgi:aldose 1-epimerase